MRKFVLAFTILVATITVVRSHGYLSEPPGRASAWRYGFNTPIDYNDNQCFCGGFNYQYSVNNGKCGICGDAWDQQPRLHEVGGPYATGTIVRSYTQGEVIQTTAVITSNHRGHFEFKICPTESDNTEVEQQCLDMRPLYQVTSTDDYKISIGSAPGEWSHQLQLPEDLVCSHCVLQWRYVAGNNWGNCGNGTGALGCGPQEEFRGCADIAILPRAKSLDKSQVADVQETSDVDDVVQKTSVIEAQDEQQKVNLPNQVTLTDALKLLTKDSIENPSSDSKESTESNFEEKNSKEGDETLNNKQSKQNSIKTKYTR